MSKISSFVSFIFGISRHKRLIIAIFLLMGLIFVLYLRKINYLTPENIISLLNLHPFLSPFLFILIDALMIIFLLPAALPMTLAAGFLWGWFWGGIMTIFSASLGAAICFLISRYLAYDYLNKKFKGRVYSSLQEEIKKNDWKIIAITRNSPLFPFGIMSYFLGLTNISFKKYFWTTILAITPGTFVVAAVGSYFGSIVLEGGAHDIFRTIFIISTLITAVIILWYIRKKYAQISKLRSLEALDEEEKDII